MDCNFFDVKRQGGGKIEPQGKGGGKLSRKAALVKLRTAVSRQPTTLVSARIKGLPHQALVESVIANSRRVLKELSNSANIYNEDSHALILSVSEPSLRFFTF